MRVITSKSGKTISLKELWDYRELFYFFIWRDIKVKYKQTVIGIVWAILQPFLTMVVFTFFFNKVAGISSGNIPYPVFSFTGLIFWNYFSSSVQEASNSFIANQSVITKVYFPRVIIPIVSTLVSLLDFFFAFIVLLGLFLFFRVSINPLGILIILPALSMTFISAVGIGGLLSILNVKYRDIRYALPFFFQILLFVTPVIYSIDKIPSFLQLILYFNPMTGVLELVRGTLFQHSQINFFGIFISLLSTVFGVILFIMIFKEFESGIADAI